MAGKDKAASTDEAGTETHLDPLEMAKVVAQETGVAMAREMARLLRPDLIEADEAKAAPKDDGKRHKVRVFCPLEKGFHRAGKHWSHDWTTAEVSTAELAQLQEEHDRRDGSGKRLRKLVVESV